MDAGQWKRKVAPLFNWRWARLLALPPLIVGLFWLWRVLPSERYEPTGDELYDKFARLVLHEFKLRGYNTAPKVMLDDFEYIVNYQPTAMTYLIQRFNPNYNGTTTAPKEMDFAAIEEWEKDFEADPRYWQLRVICGLDRAYTGPDEEWRPGDPYEPGEYVKHVLAGVCDSASIGLVTSNYGTLGDEALAQQMLEKAIEVDGNNSYWHYQKAFFHQSLGDVDHAWDELKLGNAAPENRWVRPFPYSTLFADKYNRSTARGNRLVRGLIAALNESAMPNFIQVKEHCKEASEMLLMGFEPEYADELTKALGRMGQMQAVLPEYQNVATVLAAIPSGDIKADLLSGELAADPDLLAVIGLHTKVVTLIINDLDKQLKAGGPGGIVKTPYSDFQDPLGIAMQSFGQGSFTKPTAAPMQRTDWLNYDLECQIERAFADKLRPEFDVLKDPPIARLWHAAEAQTKATPAGDGRPYEPAYYEAR